MHEDEQLSIDYDGVGKTFIYVYQMLLGDASHEGFTAFKQVDNGSYTFIFLYVVYFAATTAIVLVLMNIIIAIMGEVQAKRGEKGRAVVYATQLKVVIE